MLSSLLLATSAIALGVSAQSCPATIGVAGIQIRLPSVYVEVDASVDVDVDVEADINVLGLVDIDVDASVEVDLEASVKAWVAPSFGYIFGRPWYMTKTSSPVYGGMKDVQCELTPKDESKPSSEIDYLLSFQVGVNASVNTLYGTWTPQAGYPAGWVFASTGLYVGVSANVSVIAWGCDSNGVPYYVLYSSALVGTNIGASISLFSASADGVDELTISAIVAAVIDLDIVDISVLVQAFVGVEQDGSAIAPSGCDAVCQTNQGLLGNALIKLVLNVFRA